MRGAARAVAAGLVAGAAACGAAVGPRAARPDAVEDARALLALEAAAITAAEHHDAAALDRLIADDFTIAFQPAAGADVRFSDKARTIARWTAVDPAVVAGPTSFADARVQVAGDTGVVHAHVTDRWHDADGDHEVVTAVTDVWVRRDGRWRWVAAHESVIAPAR